MIEEIKLPKMKAKTIMLSRISPDSSLSVISGRSAPAMVMISGP